MTHLLETVSSVIRIAMITNEDKWNDWLYNMYERGANSPDLKEDDMEVYDIEQDDECV